MTRRQFLVDFVELEFRVVEQGDGRRAEIGNLPHQLAADRSARPGDQNPPVANEGLHRLAVERRLRPSQQVFDGDRLSLDAAFGLGPQLRRLG